MRPNKVEREAFRKHVKIFFVKKIKRFKVVKEGIAHSSIYNTINRY